MKPTLVILAAGMGSRYGGIKQIDKFGPRGETIIDYSLFDAIEAGFKKVVFVIRKEIEADFKEALGNKLNGKIEVEYAFQSLDLPYEGIPEITDRTKPWGTAHAIIAAKNQIQDPFAVINADDFYGKDAYIQMMKFLTENQNPKMQSMVGYQLSKTLSENGSVSRGVCSTDAEGFLVSVVEHTRIYQSGGKILAELDEQVKELHPETSVSMNFWGFMPGVIPIFEKMFIDFVKKNYQNLKSEFFIPLAVDHLMKNEGHRVKVLKNNAVWFGVTYKEDKDSVSKSLNALIDKGEYPRVLWS
jgi:choline kinase